MMTTDLFYALDRAFLPCTLVSAFSAAEHAARPLRLTLLCDGDMSPGGGGMIDTLRRHPNIASLESVKLEFDAAIGKAGHLPRSTNARLFSPRYFKARAVYLDGDTLVLSDLGDLLRYDLQDRPIGAVQDVTMLANFEKTRSKRRGRSERAKRFLGHWEESVPNFQADRYFNAGVLLLDFGVINRAGLAEAMGDVETASGYRLQDQDHLNAVFAERVCWLPSAWNVQWSNIRARQRYFDEQTRAKFAHSRRAPKVMHYAGVGGKPWDNLRRTPLKRLLSYGVANMLRMRAQYAQWRRRTADFLGRDPFEGAG